MGAVFKTPEQSVASLQVVREVAKDRMTSPIVAPERAHETYEKYGGAIDKMINIGENFAAAQKSMRDFANKVEDSKPSQASQAGVMLGGAVMGTLAAPFVPLTGGTLVSSEDIRASFKLPAEHIVETYERLDKVKSSLATYDNSVNNFKTALSSFSDAVVSGNDQQIKAAYTELSGAVASLDKSVKSLTSDLQMAEAYSGATKGALAVVGKFSAEAVVTVATMGAMGLAEKAIVHVAKTAVEAGEAAQTAALLAGDTTAELSLAVRATRTGLAIANSEAVPGVVGVARAGAKVGEKVYHAKESAKELSEDISEAGQNFE